MIVFMITPTQAPLTTGMLQAILSKARILQPFPDSAGPTTECQKHPGSVAIQVPAWRGTSPVFLGTTVVCAII
jgi:hypothetical protein